MNTDEIKKKLEEEKMKKLQNKIEWYQIVVIMLILILFLSNVIWFNVNQDKNDYIIALESIIALERDNMRMGYGSYIPSFEVNESQHVYYNKTELNEKVEKYCSDVMIVNENNTLVDRCEELNKITDLSEYFGIYFGNFEPISEKGRVSYCLKLFIEKCKNEGN